MQNGALYKKAIQKGKNKNKSHVAKFTWRLRRRSAADVIKKSI